MAVLEKLEPKAVFGYFEEICAIPHGSGNTDKISRYLADFAKERGLEHYRDSMGNVIIIKEASKGYENAPAVIIQGHMDMVCEKAPECTVDMENEGLKLALDGDTVFAEGTTLGGDDGIAVAFALALLEASDIPHPRLEVVITVDEEIGMLGAVGLEDLSMLKAKTMINIDCEEEGVFTVSCAGGIVVKSVIPVLREGFEGSRLEIAVGGLKGGHSGVEIDKGLGNSTKLLARALNALSRNTDIRLCDVQGGQKDNAIPRESSAVIAVRDIDAVYEICQRLDGEYKNEYKTDDPGVFLSVKPSEWDLPMDGPSTKRVITFLTCSPNGILSMSPDISGLVQTSLNIGILKTEETWIEASFCVRSSVESQKQMVVEELTCLTDAMGGRVELSGNYSGWEYLVNSPLRELMCQVYKEQYGKEPKIEAIHAGVECGIFSGKIPGLDCISIGPDLTEIHTCREKMSASSVKRVWEMVLEVLRRMK